MTNRKIVVSILVLYVLLISAYILFSFIQPSSILQNAFHYSFNNPERVNNILSRQLRSLIVLVTVLLILTWLYRSRYFEKIISFLKRAAIILSGWISIKSLLVITILYLCILFPLAVTHYDLGFDEAWYIDWAKNFHNTGIAYYSADGKVILIDTITMLPHYLLSFIYFSLGFAEVWQFKLLSSLLSVITLFILFNIFKKFFDLRTAVLFLFILVLQPGFGFISSSFFGELLQSAFLFSAVFIWLYNNEAADKKNVILPAVLFSIAVHTKFQLLIILFVTLVSFHFMEKKSKALRVLFYTLFFTALITLLRLVPVLLFDLKSIRHLLIIDWFIGRSFSEAIGMVFDKIQLFNRFFPLAVFIVIMVTFYSHMKRPVEKFIYIYTLVSILWWIFLYPYSTYRHPFIGIITLALMAAVLINRFYTNFAEKNTNLLMSLKYVSASGALFLLLWGFSSNLIYAYIGYNDGVQFDMDGFKNRLFSPVKYDNSQKDFYSGLKKIVPESDTLYNGSFVTRFYLKNPVLTFQKLKENFSNSKNLKYVIISRDMYPLGTG